MSNFKNIKADAWKYYKTWMKEKTFCRILNQEVKVTRKGWDHLINGSKSKKRNIRDKINRLLLLKAAKYAIKNSKKFLTESENGVNYFILEEQMDGKKIRVVLKKDKSNKVIFYSVMKK